MSKRIYFASALFNARETKLNLDIASRLEQEGYSVFLPQRDGFEFGRLTEALQESLSSEAASDAVQAIIYLLDIGWFLAQSDCVVANLDEQIDEGVIVEISYARQLGMKIFGYRTDARTPFGSANSKFGGAHFFPALQCDRFELYAMPNRTEDEAETAINKLIVDMLKFIQQNVVGNQLDRTTYSDNINRAASLLFKGLSDIHSNDSISEIVRRYISHRQEIEGMIGVSYRDNRGQ